MPRQLQSQFGQYSMSSQRSSVVPRHSRGWTSSDSQSWQRCSPPRTGAPVRPSKRTTSIDLPLGSTMRRTEWSRFIAALIDPRAPRLEGSRWWLVTYAARSGNPSLTSANLTRDRYSWACPLSGGANSHVLQEPIRRRTDRDPDRAAVLRPQASAGPRQITWTGHARIQGLDQR